MDTPDAKLPARHAKDRGKELSSRFFSTAGLQGVRLWLGSGRGAFLADLTVVVWLSVFHHVLGIKYRFAQVAYDEHFFLNEGWSVLQGQVPYRDFQEFKPPVIFFVNALALKLFGLEDLAYRNFLSLLSLASFLAFALALLSRKVSRWLVVGVTMLAIEHFYDDGLHNSVINDAETLAVDFFLLGVGTLFARTRWPAATQVLGGALLSLSPLSKEPMVFPVLGAWLCLVLLERAEPGEAKAALRFAARSAAGAASVALLWLGYMIVTDSLSWYLFQLKLSFAYTEKYAYQVRWVSKSPPGGAFFDGLRRLGKGYANREHLAVFVPLAVGLVTLTRRRLVGVGALLTFAAALYAISVGGGYAARYFIMGMAGTYFCACLGVAVLDSYAKRSDRPLRLWVGATWMTVAFFSTWPRFATEWGSYGSYAAPPPPVPQSDIDMVLKHTKPGDKIWTTDDPLLYVYSNRQSAFLGGIVLDEIIEYYPGKTDAERLSLVREGLERNRPKLVVTGNTMVSGRRKRRYFLALTKPFLDAGGYIRLSDRFYQRPD